MTAIANPSTRERIVLAAAELFSTKGFASGSLQDIADRLGITKAALYYHYESKDAILVAVLQPYLDAAQELVDRYPEVPENRCDLLAEYLDLLLDHRAAVEVIAYDRSVLNHPEIADFTRSQTSRLQELLSGERPTLKNKVAGAATLGGLRAATASINSDPNMRDLVLEIACATLKAGDQA